MFKVKITWENGEVEYSAEFSYMCQAERYVDTMEGCVGVENLEIIEL